MLPFLIHTIFSSSHHNAIELLSLNILLLFFISNCTGRCPRASYKAEKVDTAVQPTDTATMSDGTDSRSHDAKITYVNEDHTESDEIEHTERCEQDMENFLKEIGC